MADRDRNGRLRRTLGTDESTMDNRRVARTAKGQNEIASRRKSLTGKLRTVLFLIDPGKPVDAILDQVAQIGAPADALVQLAAEGYIHDVDVSPERPLGPT